MRTPTRRPLVHWTLSALLCLAWLAAAIASGQESLLDLDLGVEEELPLAPPSLEGDSSTSEQEPPLRERPVIGGGGGSLEDLLPGGTELDQEIEAEPVCDIVLAGFGESGRNQRSQKVKLLSKYETRPFPAGRKYEFVGYSNDGKGTFELSCLGRNMADIHYYELRMLSRAAEQVSLETREISHASSRLRFADQQQYDQASNAIALLATALSEHDSAVERRIRQGESWTSVREQLFQALFNVQLGQIRYQLDAGQTQAAIAACDRLKEQLPLRSPNQKFLKILYEQVFLTPAEQAVEQANYALARDLLQSYQTRYPFSQNKQFHNVQKRLAGLARQVADKALATNNVKLLDEAAEIWPQLAGLDSLRRGMVEDYPIMHCAYRTLPRRFSPLSARTAVERHAVSLIFERLVRWQNDPRLGAHYAPELATDYPTPLARGRQFALPRCVWSDSTADSPRYCTADDVLLSMQLMQRVHPLGFSPAWENLMAEVDMTRTPDPFQATVMLKRDHWQPLSLMDFPIVPKHSFPAGGSAAEIESFNAAPVGTGPYQLAKTARAGEVRLVANPQYRKPGLPQIREVVFHQLDAISARDEFLNGYLHVVHGVQPTHVVELRRQGKRVVKVPARGVYFLAPNYREPLLQNRELRLAIAHGIDRQQILDTYFRPGGGRADHAPLTGPFPAGSWAENPQVPQYVPAQADVFLDKAKQSISLRPLKLIYPDRNQETSRACAEIQRQLKAVDIEIELTAIDPLAFEQVVIDQHGFDLAYWKHDYQDETYWIWPLFDPSDRGSGGSNFMGYVPDDTLSNLFHETMIHKQFAKIRRLSHETHEYFAREAVVIPLWQLDTYVAVSDQLEGAQFDPLHFFENVEQWQLKPR